MKKFALMCLVLMTVGCGKHQEPPTNGTPVSTQGPPCDRNNFPTRNGGSSHCCVDSSTARGKEEYFVIGMTGDHGFGHRYLGQACTSEPRINEHGVSEVVRFGPCGAAKADDAEERATNVHIFKPISQGSGDVCGYKYVIPPLNPLEPIKTISVPEEFISGKQTEYPAVAAACLYTLCIGTTPGFIVFATLAQESAGMGRVVSDPRGITASRAGEAKGEFSGDVKLTAEPTGKHVRAVFSGACDNSGGYGERAECVIKPAPDPKVTVSFECEKGFKCGGGSKH